MSLRKRGKYLNEATERKTDQPLLRFANNIMYAMELCVPLLEQHIKTIEYTISGRGHISDATGKPVLTDDERQRAKQMQDEIKAFLTQVKGAVDKIYRLAK